VQKAARERLLDAADPAARALIELLDSEDEQVRLNAAKALLDRSGHGPTQKQVNVDGGKLNYRIEGVDMDAV
jgi:HEAT repeat protein